MFMGFTCENGLHAKLPKVSLRRSNPFTPKSDQFQISPAASHQKYYITQYEELGFS